LGRLDGVDVWSRNLALFAVPAAVALVAFTAFRLTEGDEEPNPLVAYGTDPHATAVVEALGLNTTYRRVTEVFVRIPDDGPTPLREGFGPEVQVHELRGHYGPTGCLTSVVAETRTPDGRVLETTIHDLSGSRRIDAGGTSAELDGGFDISGECIDDFVDAYQQRFPGIAGVAGAVVERRDELVQVTQRQGPELARPYAPELDAIAVDVIYDFRADTLEHLGHRMVATLADGSTVLLQEERLIVAEVLRD
jgi:hypothetical protein